MSEFVRHTKSVCPNCLKNIPALLTKEDGRIILRKTCPEHGDFSVPVWQGAFDFDEWTRGAQALTDGEGASCPSACGLCPEHGAGSCCVLLEVTRRCNLHCKFCFAVGGECADEPTAEELKASIRDIVEKCGFPMLQLSGGEPTLRNDLPELVSYAKSLGIRYVQINTNGIRLAEEPGYTEALAKAGTDIAFLQFDGTNDEIFRTLRGKDLLETKLAAIDACAKNRIGVTLVPTVVAGVNDKNLGELVRLAGKLVPKVRGVHFQPVSYFGRYPNAPQDKDRYTLDRLMADLCEQADIPSESFMPSRCDHPLCGFHADFMLRGDGTLKPLTSVTRAPGGKTRACVNRDYVARHWSGVTEGQPPEKEFSEEMDFDTFLYNLRHRTLLLSAMAFQDAMNLNIERLRSCSLHVYDNGAIKPFCAKYLSAFEE